MHDLITIPAFIGGMWLLVSAFREWRKSCN